MRRQYTENERSGLIELVNSGRATVAEAASRLGVTLSTAYKWRRDGASVVPGGQRANARRRATPPTFARVVRGQDLDAAVIVVRAGGAEVEIRRDFDAELLRRVVEVLGGGGG